MSTSAPTLDKPASGAAKKMRALMLTGDRKIELAEIDAPPAPASGDLQIAIKAIGLNHIDVWGWRGMAFAKAQAAADRRRRSRWKVRSSAVGPDALLTSKAGECVSRLRRAGPAASAKACQGRSRDNSCENVASIMGFHIDGFARDLVNMPARLVVKVPDNVNFRDAACAPVAFGTVQHMLFDNAKLQPGETILVQAGGSGIGTSAIKMAKAIGATVFTTRRR